jgi:hypothetical protein
VSEESIVNQVWQTLAAMYILATASYQMRPDETGRNPQRQHCNGRQVNDRERI